MRIVLTVVHVFCALSIWGLVMLQRGKGADAGAGFGAGASGTVFGARGATTALSRATAILAAIFMITSLSLAYVGTRKSTVPSSALLDQLGQHSSVPVTAPAGAGAASGSGTDTGAAAAPAGAAPATVPAAPAASGSSGAGAPK